MQSKKKSALVVPEHIELCNRNKLIDLHHGSSSQIMSHEVLVICSRRQKRRSYSFDKNQVFNCRFGQRFLRCWTINVKTEKTQLQLVEKNLHI